MRVRVGPRGVIMSLLALGLLTGLHLASLGQTSGCVLLVQPGDSIQAAVDSAAPGSVICVAEGIWDENILILKPLVIQGNGRGRTIIRGTHWGEPGIVIGISEGTSPRGVILEALTLEGRHEFGVVVREEAEVCVRDCTISGNLQSGLWVTDSSVTRLTNCEVAGNLVGIRADSEAELSIVDSSIRENRDAAVMLEDSARAALLACSITRNGDGVVGEAAAHIELIGSVIEGNRGYGVRLAEPPCEIGSAEFVGDVSGRENAVAGNLAGELCPPGIDFLLTQEGGRYEVPAAMTVNEQKISWRELDGIYAALTSEYHRLYAAFGRTFDTQLQGTEGAFRYLQYLAQSAEVALRRVLIRQASRELGVAVRSSDLEQAASARFQALLTQYALTESQFEGLLEFVGQTLEGYRTDLAAGEEARLLEEQVRSAVVGNVASPTEQQVAAYYEAHQDRYGTEPVYLRVGHILTEDLALAQRLYAEAQGLEVDFSSLAREYSLDESTRDTAGETAWFAGGGSTFSSRVEEAALRLSSQSASSGWSATRPPSDLLLVMSEAAEQLSAASQVAFVVDEEGFHILKLIARRATPIPLPSAWDAVRADCAREEREKCWTNWLATRRMDARIDASDLLLSAALLHDRDISEAIRVLIDGRVAGSSDYPYLEYDIGRLQETLLSRATENRAKLEARADRTPEEEAQLARLRTEEANLREEAIAAYLAFIETGLGDEDFYRRLLGLCPESAEGHYALAELYRVKGKWLEAEAEYRRAINARPGLAAACVGLGDSLMALGLANPAAETYQKALEIQAGDITLILKLATAWLKQSELDRAQPFLAQVLSLEPENAAALTLYGDLLLAQGDAAGAVARYDSAYKLSLTVTALLNLARAYLAAGQPAEAEQRYMEALRRSPYSAEAQLGLGDAYLRLGKREKALESYRQALARSFAGSLRETAARKILELDPGDLRTRSLLAGCLRDRLECDGAIAEYEEVLRLSPGEFEALVGLGDCYNVRDQYDQALDFYRQALASPTTDQQKLSTYARMLTAEQDRVGSQNSLLISGLELLWQRAQTYARLGRCLEGVADLKRIQRADPRFRADEVADLLVALVSCT